MNLKLNCPVMSIHLQAYPRFKHHITQKVSKWKAVMRHEKVLQCTLIRVRKVQGEVFGDRERFDHMQICAQCMS